MAWDTGELPQNLQMFLFSYCTIALEVANDNMVFNSFGKEVTAIKNYIYNTLHASRA